MSEPSSLYARLPLRPSEREAFLDAPAALPSAFPDWAPWAAGREMWGGSLSAAEIRALTAMQGQTAREALASWLDADYPFPGNAHETYDEAAGLWTLTVIEFSDNYREWITWLSVLRGAASFVSADGLIVVHDFLWGDTESDVAIQVAEGTSALLDPPPSAAIQEASGALRWRTETFG